MIASERVFSLLNISKDRGNSVCKRVRDCTCGTRVTYGPKIIYRDESCHDCIPVGVGQIGSDDTCVPLPFLCLE